MKELNLLTDLEIKRKIADINNTGYIMDCLETVIFAPSSNGLWPYDPLSQWSITGPLMIEFGITLSKSMTDKKIHVASFFTGVNCSGQLKEIFSQDPQRAICLAIIAQHRLKGDTE